MGSLERTAAAVYFIGARASPVRRRGRSAASRYATERGDAMILQLSAYGVLWIVLPLIVFAAAREGGWPGALVAHVAIALVIVLLDVRWVASHGLNPPDNWLGGSIAIMLRAVLINVLLFPLSVIALWLRHRAARPVA